MASVQRKNTNFVAISCLVLVLLSLGFQPLQAALTGCPGFQPLQSALNGCPEKRSWPELVGIPGCEASARIKKENSELNPFVIPHDAGTPRNYDCFRVFIRIKGHFGLVYDTPIAV